MAKTPRSWSSDYIAAQAAASSLLISPEKQKNYIINGNFDFWQRGTSFADTGSYTADRYCGMKNGTGNFLISRSTTVPNSVSSYSLQFACTGGSGLPSGNFYGFEYRVEGSDLLAIFNSQLTISFWVQSSITGTFSVAFRSSGADRSFIAPYTINAANVWEKKVLTIDAPSVASSGTWAFDSANIGMRIGFILGAASDFQTATTNAWTTGNFIGAAGQTNFMSNGNTIKFSQIMLNLGEKEAPFQLSGTDIEGELSRCQRYYEKGNMFAQSGTAVSNQTTWVSFAAAKRATPTMTQYQAAIQNSATISSFQSPSTNGSALTINFSAGTGNINVFWAAEAEL